VPEKKIRNEKSKNGRFFAFYPALLAKKRKKLFRKNGAGRLIGESGPYRQNTLASSLLLGIFII
jgi:hypothetical protein